MKFEKPKKKKIDWYGRQVNVPFDCQIYPVFIRINSRYNYELNTHLRIDLLTKISLFFELSWVLGMLLL